MGMACSRVDAFRWKGWSQESFLRWRPAFGLG